MSSTTPLFRGFVTALAASLSWALLSADSIARPDPETYRDVLFLIPWVLTALAIVRLHLAQRDRSGRLGLAGFRLTIGAMTVSGFAMTAVTLGIDELAILAFPLGVLAWIAGMVMLGIATLRAGVFRRSAGLALIAAEPLTIALGAALSPWVPLSDTGSYSGALGNSLAMLVIALAMRHAARDHGEVPLRGWPPAANQRAGSDASSALS